MKYYLAIWTAFLRAYFWNLIHPAYQIYAAKQRVNGDRIRITLIAVGLGSFRSNEGSIKRIFYKSPEFQFSFAYRNLTRGEINR